MGERNQYRLLKREDIEIDDLYLVPHNEKNVETRVDEIEDNRFTFRSPAGIIIGYDHFDNPRGILVKLTPNGLELLVGQTLLNILRLEQQKAIRKNSNPRQE